MIFRRIKETIKAFQDTEEIDDEVFMEDEWDWDPMTMRKASRLRSKLLYWTKFPKEGGHDIRLIEGALAVCSAYIQRCRRDERNGK